MRQERNDFVDFVTFRRMLSPAIIGVVTFVGMLVPIGIGLVLIARGSSGQPMLVGNPPLAMQLDPSVVVAVGVLILVGGSVAVRVVGEVLVLPFRINETLSDIAELLEERNEDVREPPPYRRPPRY